MHTFSDFDAWGDAVRGANLRLTCDAVEEPIWQLSARPVDDVVVQVAREGGGNLCYGGSLHPGLTLFMPVTTAGHYVCNGERLDEQSILAIPPGADFRIYVHRKAHAWCSVALPPDRFPWFPETTGMPRDSFLIRPPGDTVARLRDLIRRAALVPALDEPATPAATVAARALTAVATACLDPRPRIRPAPGRPQIDRWGIIRGVHDLLDRGTVPRPTIAEIATIVGVNERTLARAFHESFGVSPRVYLQLRLLHDVRRTLRRADVTTIARVLTMHGVWDFGRFGIRYRRQFGETMSETVGRRRVGGRR